MSVVFSVETRVRAPVTRVFELSLSADLHVDSMSRFGERAIAGVATGQLALGDTVTWRARHFGVPWTMTSRISALDAPRFFVDEQVRGPFAAFRHEHHFDGRDGVTTMRDVVAFRAPLGPLGRAFERLVLARYLRALIEKRNQFLKQAAETGGA